MPAWARRPSSASSKLEHIAHPGSVDVFSRPGYFCKKVVAEAARYFVEKKPQVEFMHFSDPDDRGHADGWMSDAAARPQSAAATSAWERWSTPSARPAWPMRLCSSFRRTTAATGTITRVAASKRTA